MTCDWWSSRGSIVTAAESAKTKPKTGWAEYDLYDIVKQLQVRPWVCCDHRNTDAAGTGASANTQTRARARKLPVQRTYGDVRTPPEGRHRETTPRPRRPCSRPLSFTRVLGPSIRALCASSGTGAGRC